MMTERELKKLSRTDLLEMLIEQSRENEKLRMALEEANERLADRKMTIDKAGSLMDACLQINGVFEAAQAACLQYTENIKILSSRQEEICCRLELETKEKCSRLEKETTEKCSAQERETAEKCSAQERETTEKCSAQEQEIKEKCETMERETTERCVQMEHDMKIKCTTMLDEAKAQTEAYWLDVSGKIQELTKSYNDLQHLWEKTPFAGR